MTQNVETPTQAEPHSLRVAIATDKQRVLYAILAAAALFVVGEWLRPGFASAEGIKTVLIIASFVGIVAAGQACVMYVGGIDLSVPWVVNAAAILLATSSAGLDSRALPAVLLTIGMGALVGATNGICIVYLSVSPVVMTLAMNGVVEGLTLGLSSGMTCQTCASYAPPSVRAGVNAHFLGIPSELYLWGLVLLIGGFVMSRTVFGRSIYAIGTNRRASFLAGLNVNGTILILYILSGVFSAVAGIALVGFGGQASLGMGDPYLFQSIAAAVIGGIYISGGRGHFVGTAAGAVSLVTLVSVLMALNMPEYGRTIVYGLIILSLLLMYGREPPVS
jgi:ribose transport system permease protein